jgi:4-amino-4-deoxy-L-arabinose transferase-like glycosyltransferase
MPGQNLKAAEARLHNLALLAILLVAIVLRLIFLQGFVQSDPYCYAELANDLANGKLLFGDYNGALVFPLRIAFYGPVALFIKLLGLSEWALVLFPFLVSIAGCVLAYVLARNLFGPTAGLLAAGLLAILPTDIAMASTLFPDPVAAFWANLGIALLILDPDKNGSRRSLSYSALAGICFGISWLNKETVVYLGPLVLIYLLLRKSSVLHLACVAAVAFLFLFSEAAFYRVTTGDWLFHFHMVPQNFQQNAVWFFDQSSPYFGWKPGGYVQALLRRLFVSGPRAELTAFSKLPVFALIAVAWGLFVRDRRFAMLGLWLVTQMLFFNFGSSSLTSYRPLPLEFFERYLYPLLLPSVVLCSGFLTLLYQQSELPGLASRRWLWAPVVACGMLVSIAFSLKDLRPHPLEMIRHVAERLKPSDVVYTDFYTAEFLAFFAQNKILNAEELANAKPIIPYEKLKTEDMQPGAYVLISDRNVDFAVSRQGTTKYEAPEFYAQHPSSWRLISRERGVSLFRIEETRDGSDAKNKGTQRSKSDE